MIWFWWGFVRHKIEACVFHGRAKLLVQEIWNLRDVQIEICFADNLSKRKRGPGQFVNCLRSNVGFDSNSMVHSFQAWNQVLGDFSCCRSSIKLKETRDEFGADTLYIYIYQIQVKKHFSKGTLSGDASGRWYRAFGRDISKQEKCVEAWKQF